MALTSRVHFAHEEMNLNGGVQHLEAVFKSKVEELSSALKEVGLTLFFDNRRISAKGQYLRYWSWRIAKEGYRRSRNPPPPSFPGCDIDWFWATPDPTCYVTSAEAAGVPSYVGAAMEMVKYFRLTERPALSTKLSEGKAAHFYIQEIGQSCSLNYPRAVRGKDGNTYVIPFGVHHPGFKENPNLCALFATYGIYPEQDDSDPEFTSRKLSTQMWSGG